MFTLDTLTYTVRKPGTREEWDIVKKLLVAYKHEFNDDTCFTSFEEELANIESYYDSDDKLKLVAVSDVDGSLAGCVAFKTILPGIAEMKRLYVVPSHRGRQLGRRLTEAVIHYARQGGYQKIVLDTMLEMKAAQQLYHQLGFSIIASYNHQDSAKLVCFEKDLNSL